MFETEQEKSYLKFCPNCRKAKKMQEEGKTGHTLRYRSNTREWVHDFVTKTTYSHSFCLATQLRNQNGR